VPVPLDPPDPDISVDLRMLYERAQHDTVPPPASPDAEGADATAAR